MAAYPTPELGAGSRSAIFSPDRTWRYELRITRDASRPPVAFIGLNPSTADEVQDDPTVRRCLGFARRWGFGSLLMLNAFAFRATDPRVMQAAEDPVGPDNDRHLVEAASRQPIVAAWGVRGAYGDRARHVRELLDCQLYALALTKRGEPRHPLYVRGDATMIELPR